MDEMVGKMQFYGQKQKPQHNVSLRIKYAFSVIDYMPSNVATGIICLAFRDSVPRASMSPVRLLQAPQTDYS